MNEHLNSNATRPSDARSTSGEQVYAGTEQRERSTDALTSQARKCGLDTGSRGWRYVYQTH